MNTRFTYSVLIACSVFLLYACKNVTSKSHGPIILGDSSAIVTERDPQKLEDLVTELHPVIPPSEDNKDNAVTTKDTIVRAHLDTIKKGSSLGVRQVEMTTSGLKADFKEISVLIGNVNAKQSGNLNLQHANGAVYTLTNGSINGNILKITGNVTKVSQRYQTIIILKTGGVNLAIDALTNTTDWKTLPGGNDMYRISGLDPSSLEYADDGPAAIRNAVSKAAKRHRINRNKTQELVNSLRNARAANQKPLYVMLRSVMWKIDGKDERGRSFSKQVRIDIPL